MTGPKHDIAIVLTDKAIAIQFKIGVNDHLCS